MRYKITVEYLGTNYSGWQWQKNALSVQEVLQKGLSTLFQEAIKVEGSGRTDKGVHALGQVAHFDAEKEIAPYSVTMAVNTLLPRDVRVKLTEVVGAEFHARFNPKNKTYLYKFYVSSTSSPTRSLTHAQIIPGVDTEKMRIAAQDLLGEHDFKGFSATGSHITDNIRTVYSAEITENGDEIFFRITGNGFLYNMVRIIAGTLVYIGKGKLPLNAVRTILDTKERTKGGKTFPPEGLYLESVEYPEVL